MPPLDYRERFRRDLRRDISRVEKRLNELLDNQSKGVYNAIKNIEKYTKENQPDPINDTDYDPEEFKKKIWKNISKEWSDSLSKQLTSFLKIEFADILTDRIFDVLVGIDNENDENEEDEEGN